MTQDDAQCTQSANAFSRKPQLNRKHRSEALRKNLMQLGCHPKNVGCFQVNITETGL